ncbi:hypothetical protein [Kineosporia sp. NBRC 101677]|uniref:hypothetical protein n=1 Tax=Kineosporia sp. NBRC 101677 TaxID=3032197 RepID=UPI002552C20D|nr:hypothetical protein [Kineosporia sp. NBRC 101677]
MDEALRRPQTSTIPHPDLKKAGIVTTARLTERGLQLALDLDRFIAGDLSGLIDAETSTDLDLDAALLVFDTSALPHESPALALVLASSFLTAVWVYRPWKRLIVL